MMKLTLMLLVTVFVACVSGVEKGQRHFERGQYAEAKAVFEEPNSLPQDENERVRYELYRGLTYHALGDSARAQEWLMRAKNHAETRPGSLGTDDRARLSLALDAVKDAPKP